MSRQPGGNGQLARGASAAAAKGAALIALAVIVGVFLLQHVDTSNAGSPATSVKPHSPKTTTTKPRTSKTTSSTSTTTVPAAPLKTPAELKVLVLNAGAASGTAATLRTKLQQVGYTSGPPANTWSGHKQSGTSLMCKPGFDREKIALSQQTALQGVKVVSFASPAPPFSADVDCVIVVGS